MDTTPLPGTIGLTQISGFTGKLVWLMQFINQDVSRWTHVFIALDDGTLFEAQPGGAQVVPLATYDGKPVAYLPTVLTDQERVDIVRHARSLTGIGYGWSTYLYLAAYRFGVRPRWLRDRVRTSQRMICSQAADHAYLLAGVSLFRDGRMPQDVTPGDLARLLR